MIPIIGTISGYTFITNSGFTIKNYHQGVLGWLSHFFGRSVWVNVRDEKQQKNFRLYVPLTEVRQIIKHNQIPLRQPLSEQNSLGPLQQLFSGRMKQISQRVGTLFVRTLNTLQPPSSWEVFKQPHKDLSTNLNVQITVTDHYQLRVQIFNEQNHCKGSALLTLYTFQDGGYQCKSRMLSDQPSSLMGLFDEGSHLDLNTVQLCGNLADQRKTVRTLLQAIKEFGNFHGCEDRIFADISYWYSILFHEQGMRSNNPRVATQAMLPDDASQKWTDLGSSTMQMPQECFENLDQQIWENPIFSIDPLMPTDLARYHRYIIKQP